MLGIIDPVRRPLSIPSHFVPYLEKHRIYELFYELATELIIKKPNDHILYLKQCLHHAARKRDVSRIILLAYPGFDKVKLAESLQCELGVCTISLDDIQKRNELKIDNHRREESDDIAKEVKNIIKTGLPNDFGWVFVDFPRTKFEAYSLQRNGIIPTHVIEILNHTSDRKLSDEVNRHHRLSKIPKKRSINPEDIKYRKHIIGIREAYVNSLIQVEIGERSIEDLGKDCAKLAKLKKHSGAPSVFRIVLIGSRGSGCRTIAKCLSQRFNIIYVDFNYILEQFRLQKTPLGDVFRKLENKWGAEANSKIKIQVVEKRIMQRDCVNKGWILTGYPITVEDFKLLDQLSTPPNRIFFVDVDGDICRERLVSRQSDKITGNEKNIISENNKVENVLEEISEISKDYQATIKENIREYEENVQELKNYAGESALVINGNLHQKFVREKIEAFLMKPAPFGRRPQFSPEIDPTQIEFDVDEEHDTEIFEKIP